jgi:peptide/nickel transport system permease protein
VPSFKLYTKHALRNAILPVLTGIGTSFGYLLTGSFIVETAFLVPGMGHEAINAIQKGDTPVIMACVIVTGALFILVNLLVDLVQQVVDPRIRESQV